jgi:hypothetical protein
MSEIPASMLGIGPVPGQVIFSLMAEDSGDEGALVTFGTADRSCKLCGETDFLLGWSQSKMTADKMASIHLMNPVWKAKVSADSVAINFGDTLECATGGKVRKDTAGMSSTIAGKAMCDAVADGFVLFVPAVCCPTAASS